MHRRLLSVSATTHHLLLPSVDFSESEGVDESSHSNPLPCPNPLLKGSTAEVVGLTASSLRGHSPEVSAVTRLHPLALSPFPSIR